MEEKCQAQGCENAGLVEYQGYCEPHWQAFAGVVLNQLFQAALIQQHLLANPTPPSSSPTATTTSTTTTTTTSTVPFGFLGFECIHCGRRFVSKEEGERDAFCVVSYHPGEFEYTPGGPEKEEKAEGKEETTDRYRFATQQISELI